MLPRIPLHRILPGIVLPALLAPLGLRAQGEPAQPKGQVLETVPIHDLVATLRTPLLPPLSSLLGEEAANDQGAPGQLLGPWPDVMRRLQPQEALELVRQLSAMDIGNGPTRAWVQGETLLLTGPAEQVALVHRAADKLFAVVAEPITVTAELYRMDGDARPKATASADELRQVMAAPGFQRLWQQTAVTASGDPVALLNTRFTPFVFDVDVEVAKSAKIGDPKLRLMFEGVHIVVEPHALAGCSDIVMYCQLALGERRAPLALRSTGVDDLATLDVPDVNITTGSCSGRVRSGDSLCLAVHGAGATDAKLLLVLTATRAKAQPALGIEAGLLPIGALVSPSLRRKATVRAPEQHVGSGGGILPLTISASKQDGVGQHGVDDITALLGETVSQKDLSFTMMGTWLHVAGTKEQREAVARMLASMQDQWLRTVQVDLSTTLVPAAEHGDRAGSSAASLAGAITFPALLGHWHTLVQGAESTALWDFDVEIAEKASIANPVVTPTFSGIVASLFAYPTREAIGVSSTLDLAAVREPQRRPTEARGGGDLYAPAIERAHFEHEGPLPGGTIELGDGPLFQVDGRLYHSRQSLRITPR